MTRTASLKAFAKVNLGLRVLSKRPDGYHELSTVFQTVSLADSLEIAYSPSRTTQISVLGTPEIQDNLVERSARKLLDLMKISAKAVFTLGKKVPTGAGLGGGSSDAAAVLLALPVLAGKRISMEILHDVASELGSDVAYFLRGGTALGMGRGEELYPLPDAPSARALLVAPAIHSSTADAYRDLSVTLTSQSAQTKLSSFQSRAWSGCYTDMGNDFERVIFARHPELARIRERLIRLGATSAMMTGSGSSIFGIFSDLEKLSKARLQFSNAQVFPVSFVSRARYQSSWIRALQPHVKGSEWPPQSLYAR